MSLKLFSATIALNPNTVLFDENRSFSNNTQTRLPLGPTSPMANQTLTSQLENPQIFVLYVLRSGCSSTQRS